VRLCVGHGDGYDATAIATACCVLQLLDGTIARPGLSFAGAAVEPQRMFRDLERLGMAVSVSTEAA
jgi:hypothetical protein